jgi:signal peptidase I
VRAYGKAIGLALLLAVFVRGVGLEAFKIPSASMLPTLQLGDYVLIDRLRYGLRLPGLDRWLVRYSDPKPGDVIVFANPRDLSADYVKRVIAVAGEVVEIRNKQVFVDGVARDVPSAYFTQRAHVQLTGPRDNFGPARVPPGQVFVLGDNRDQSIDSRYWGFVDVNDVEGKALLVYWSVDGDDGSVRWERTGRMVR